MLRGIDLAVDARRDRRRARLQRRRQVDAQPHDFRRRCAPRAAPSASTGMRSIARSLRRIVARGPHSGAGRPLRLSQPVACRTISISAAIGARAITGVQNRERVFAIFPRLRRAAIAACRHALGRRAADARHRPRADGRAKPAHPRRAFARPRRRCWSRSSLRLIQRINGQGIAASAGRAERGAEPRSRPIGPISSKTAACVLDGASDHLRNDPNLKRAYLGL